VDLTKEVVINTSCNNSCLTCENSAENCTLCKIGKNRNNNPPSCECKFGFHDFD